MFDSNRMSRSGAKTKGRDMSVKPRKRQKRTRVGDEGRPERHAKANARQREEGICTCLHANR